MVSSSATVHSAAPVFAAEPAPPGPALWKVADEDTTIYLFGTIHFLPEDTAWYRPHVRQALQASGELVTEFDPAEAAKIPWLMEQNAYLPEGENLRDLLAPEDRQAFEGLLVSKGIPVGAFDRNKPWSAGLVLSATLTVMAGFNPESGVEQALKQYLPAGMQRAALEPIELQVDIYNSLPQDTQITYLNEIVASSGTIGSFLEEMRGEWLEGDEQGLAELANLENADHELHARFYANRNAAWADWVDDRLDRPGTAFVAVGAGHLVGKDSLQQRLEMLGIASTRVR